MTGERYYVQERFGELGGKLHGICEAMPIKRKTIGIYRERNNLQRAKEAYSELSAEKDKLTDTVRSVQLLFNESGMRDAADYAMQLYGAVLKFNLMTEDYTKFCAALTRLCDMIPKPGTVSAKDIGHMMNEVKMGYFPTDIGHVTLIKRALHFPDNTVNILDPCCGCGLALESLAVGENTRTYGIEIDEARGEEAEQRLYRVGFGSFYHSRISHEAFHALFLNPPYLNVIGEGGIKARSEKRFLVESMHHLMTGGVLMYIVPYYRLTWDIWRVLCDNFRDISVYRFRDGEFKKFRQVVVFGVKTPKRDGSEEAETYMNYSMRPEKIPLIDTLPQERYTLPEKELSVSVFNGAVFNLGELRRQLRASKSLDMLFERSRIDAEEKRPLLPLNVSQVGLIGGSGLINGYVDCDCPHVIKGRVIKEVKRRMYSDSDTLSETRVNRMLFNVLTPDGVKRLA